MKYLKTLKYNFRKSVPLFALAGATLLPGCKPDLKDEDKKDPYTPPVAKHETTYYWDANDITYRKTDGLNKICASLDSSSVEKVNLVSLDITPWDGYLVSNFKKNYIGRFFDSLTARNVPQEQMNKINFSGNLRTMCIDNLQDSAWVSEKYPDLKFINSFRTSYAKQR